MKPHKHSEVIKEFIYGKECEYYIPYADKWEKINFLSDFDNMDKVRVKPEPLIHEEYVIFYNDGRWSSYVCQQEVPKNVRQIKTTYHDCILVNAKVIK